MEYVDTHENVYPQNVQFASGSQVSEMRHSESVLNELEIMLQQKKEKE